MTQTLQELKTKLYEAFDEALRHADYYGHDASGAAHRSSAARLAEAILKAEQQTAEPQDLGKARLVSPPEPGSTS
jgi:hypothetical protein